MDFAGVAAIKHGNGYDFCTDSISDDISDPSLNKTQSELLARIEKSYEEDDRQEAEDELDDLWNDESSDAIQKVLYPKLEDLQDQVEGRKPLTTDE